MRPHRYNVLKPLGVLRKRFWSHVKKGPGCWLWTGALMGNGYGTTYVSLPHGRYRGAHRAAWALIFGPIPKGKYVLHKCDNKLCVRPGHLWLGTPRDNMVDMGRKGRANNGRHKLSKEAVLHIRAMRGKASQQSLANLYGVHQGTISEAQLRKTWRNF